MEIVPRDIMSLNPERTNAKVLHGEHLWEKTKTGPLKNDCTTSRPGFPPSSPYSPFYNVDNLNNSLISIIYPTSPSGVELSSYVNQSLYNHMVQWIYHISGLVTGRKSIYHISGPMTGAKWGKAVKKNWRLARQCICESCVRRSFAQSWYGLASERAQKEVSDLAEKIMQNDCSWSSLFDDRSYDINMKSHVLLIEVFRQSKITPEVPKPCNCASRKRDTKDPSISNQPVQSTSHQSAIKRPLGEPNDAR